MSRILATALQDTIDDGAFGGENPFAQVPRQKPKHSVERGLASAPLLDAEITSVLGVRITTPARSLVDDVIRSTGSLDQIEPRINEAIEHGLALGRSNLMRDRRAGFSTRSVPHSLGPFHRAFFANLIEAIKATCGILCRWAHPRMS